VTEFLLVGGRLNGILRDVQGCGLVIPNGKSEPRLDKDGEWFEYYFKDRYEPRMVYLDLAYGIKMKTEVMALVGMHGEDVLKALLKHQGWETWGNEDG